MHFRTKVRSKIIAKNDLEKTGNLTPKGCQHGSKIVSTMQTFSEKFISRKQRFWMDSFQQKSRFALPTSIPTLMKNKCKMRNRKSNAGNIENHRTWLPKACQQS
jgi:hypothetical protein